MTIAVLFITLFGCMLIGMPIAVAHGEGRAEFSSEQKLASLVAGQQLSLKYVDNYGQVASRYPANPNGSPAGTTAFTTTDGRATIMMPHPARLFRSVQMSYRTPGTFEGEAGPWLKMFQNARASIG